RDMGIYAQVIWNTSHGRPFASTLLEDNKLHIAEHVAPIMAVIAPPYALGPGPPLLLLLQPATLAPPRPPGLFWARVPGGERGAGLLLGARPGRRSGRARAAVRLRIDADDLADRLLRVSPDRGGGPAGRPRDQSGAGGPGTAGGRLAAPGAALRGGDGADRRR